MTMMNVIMMMIIIIIIHDDDDDNNNNNTNDNNELSRLDPTGKSYRNSGSSFDICILLLFAIRSITFYEAVLFSATQKCIRLLPRGLTPQNSNYDIMQC